MPIGAWSKAARKRRSSAARLLETGGLDRLRGPVAERREQAEVASSKWRRVESAAATRTPTSSPSADSGSDDDRAEAEPATPPRASAGSSGRVSRDQDRHAAVDDVARAGRRQRVGRVLGSSAPGRRLAARRRRCRRRSRSAPSAGRGPPASVGPVGTTDPRAPRSVSSRSLGRQRGLGGLGQQRSRRAVCDGARRGDASRPGRRTRRRRRPAAASRVTSIGDRPPAVGASRARDAPPAGDAPRRTLELARRRRQLARRSSSSERPMRASRGRGRRAGRRRGCLDDRRPSASTTSTASLRGVESRLQTRVARLIRRFGLPASDGSIEPPLDGRFTQRGTVVPTRARSARCRCRTRRTGPASTSSPSTLNGVPAGTSRVNARARTWTTCGSSARSPRRIADARGRQREAAAGRARTSRSRRPSCGSAASISAPPPNAPVHGDDHLPRVGRRSSRRRARAARSAGRAAPASSARRRGRRAGRGGA